MTGDAASAVPVVRVVEADWPAVWDSLRASGPPAWFPSLRLALWDEDAGRLVRFDRAREVLHDAEMQKASTAES